MKKHITEGQRVKEKHPRPAVRVVGSRKAAAPSAEKQIAQVERTFTDRWEW